jgi:DNA invertase Pin-like site-specific DNA recombinase
MATMSKAERIRKLFAKGKSTTEIAKIVGCTTTYARVCARQRINGQSVWDKAYNTSDKEKERRAKLFRERYHGDPKFRADFLEAARRRRYEARA